jgi:hypothetical protein
MHRGRYGYLCIATHIRHSRLTRPDVRKTTSSTSFATQSFIAEIAQAQGKDHPDLLMELLGPAVGSIQSSWATRGTTASPRALPVPAQADRVPQGTSRHSSTGVRTMIAEPWRRSRSRIWPPSPITSTSTSFSRGGKPCVMVRKRSLKAQEEIIGTRYTASGQIATQRRICVYPKLLRIRAAIRRSRAASRARRHYAATCLHLQEIFQLIASRQPRRGLLRRQAVSARPTGSSSDRDPPRASPRAG